MFFEGQAGNGPKSQGHLVLAKVPAILALFCAGGQTGAACIAAVGRAGARGCFQRFIFQVAHVGRKSSDQWPHVASLFS